METFTTILGYASDPVIAERLHELGHLGRIEYLIIGKDDSARRRLRRSTDKGTECAIALPRDQRLGDGAVLALADRHAIVVRLATESWLTLEPRDARAALELGYCCGNLHWRVRFDGLRLKVALEGPEADYLARLRPLLEDGRVRRNTNG
jgi:urease accessory protein